MTLKIADNGIASSRLNLSNFPSLLRNKNLLKSQESSEEGPFLESVHSYVTVLCNATVSAMRHTRLCFPTIMASMENEDKRIHIAITCMCSSASCDVHWLTLLQTSKVYIFPKSWNLEYLDSVGLHVVCTLFCLLRTVPISHMWCPHWTRKHIWLAQWFCELFHLLIGFNLTPSSLSKSSADLNIKLYAKRNHHDDILLAQKQVQVDAFDDDPDSEGLSCQ